MYLTLYSLGRRGKGCLWRLFYETLTPFMRPHPHDLIIPWSSHLLIPSLLGVKTPCINFGRIQIIAQSINIHTWVCGVPTQPGKTVFSRIAFVAYFQMRWTTGEILQESWRTERKHEPVFSRLSNQTNTNQVRCHCEGNSQM